MFGLIKDLKDTYKSFEKGRQKRIEEFSLNLLDENTIMFENCNSIDSINIIVKKLCKDLKENRNYEYTKLAKTFWGSQVSFESLVDEVTINIDKKIKYSMRSNIFNKNSGCQINANKKPNISFYTKLTGVTIGNRQEYIKKFLHNGTRLHLTRDRYNKFDPYAIAAYINSYHIGYLPKERAKDIAKYMDNGIEFECTVEKVTGGNGYNYGVNVKITNSTNMNNINNTHINNKYYYEDENDYEDVDQFMRDNGYDPEEDSIFDMYNWD